MTTWRVMPTRMPLSCGGVQDDAVLRDENIVGRAFADKAEVIAHHGFLHAGVDRFPLGENVVEVIEGS